MGWILEGQPLEMIEWVFSGSPPLVKRSIGNEPSLRSIPKHAMQYSSVADSWKKMWQSDLENVLNNMNRKSVADLLPHFYLMYSQPVPERFFTGMQIQCYNGILLGRHHWLLLTIPFLAARAALYIHWKFIRSWLSTLKLQLPCVQPPTSSWSQWSWWTGQDGTGRDGTSLSVT